VFSDLERPPLDQRFLTGRLCRPESMWSRIEVVAETASTNADLAGRAGEDEGLVLVAEYQNAGKGRMGRTWSAPPRSALLFSMLLHPATVPPERWPLLGLIAPLAVAAAVRSTGEVEAMVKWPNDVQVEDRKLAGILLERVGDAAIVGIGLNVSLRREERPDEAATSLALEGAATTDRVTVLAAVLRAFESRYRDWVADHGHPAAVLAAYGELSATLGQKIRAELPDGKTIEGTATGIDVDGRLVVEGSTGRTALAAGDVVHVRSR
jgi:BirA family transcriptional regulator, biotin operon repressor / biotin---[acetyl-CoA-carboxylase] ligase